MYYNDVQAELHSLIADYVSINPIDEGGRRPIFDGLTNPERYAKAPLKVMFVLKEAYDSDPATGEIGSGGWDHADYLNDDDYNIITDVQTHRRVAQIATGIFRGLAFDDPRRLRLSEAEELDDFKSVGWINVGKFPAPDGGTTSATRLRAVYDYWRPVLLKQIEAYNPDVVIFGNTFSEFKRDLMPGLETVAQDWPTHVYRDKSGRLYLDAYHPGVRSSTVDPATYVDSIIAAVKAHAKK